MLPSRLLCTIALLTLLPLAAASGEESRFPMSEISSEQLLDYTEQLVSRHDHRQDLSDAVAELRRRLDRGVSPFLTANQERLNQTLFTADLQLARHTIEQNLYTYQRNPEQMVQILYNAHPPRSAQLSDTGELADLAAGNAAIGLYLLAVFAAYDLSLGEWDQALSTLELYEQLPPGARQQDIDRFEALMEGLRAEVRRYAYAHNRLPIPEFFIATTGFGLAAVSAADLLHPGFRIPFFPGESQARTAALSGTIIGGSLIGITGIMVPSMLRTPPLEPMVEYLSREWGHLIEGSLQIFEDHRHRRDQVIVLTLTPNRFVVFPDSAEPRELPGVFAVTQPGRFRIQVSRGLDRVTTPAVELKPGINIIPLTE